MTTVTGQLSLVFCVACLVTDLTGAIVLTQPEQIHLALTDQWDKFVVTWVTQNATSTPMVEYGVGQLTHQSKGISTKFTDGGNEKRTLYIHRANMTGLKPSQNYVYHVGSEQGWSELFGFRSFPEGTSWSPRLAVYGDMGNKNAQSLPRLQEETQKGHFDAVLHVGDFAYDMDADNARVGDAFMNQIQAIAAYLPYMTSSGNHEALYNFSNYKNRFTMPGGDGQGMFYSFNLGPAHFVSFSAEFYYFLEYGKQQIINQFRWLERDLQEANRPEARAVRPWIITMTHRPMYCSNNADPEHCVLIENMARVGIPIVRTWNLEKLLYEYGVDLHLQAHEHAYERFWPVYNRKVCNGSYDKPYVNPKAPVHIMTGSSGCQEGHDYFLKRVWPWSAFHSDAYGYTRMTIHNGTHLHVEQVADNMGGVVIDEMMLIKTRHGPDVFDCA